MFLLNVENELEIRDKLDDLQYKMFLLNNGKEVVNQFLITIYNTKCSY